MTDSTRAELERQAREVEEALAAVGDARARAREAGDRLASAHSWGTYDTWFGGGLFSSLTKHDRIADAEDAMRQVDSALETVRRELADVGVADVGGAGGVGVEPLSRTLDIWFDNFFSDWGTQSRIKDARARMEALGSVLARAEEELLRRRAALREQLGAAEG